jgi:hypothetical protein
MARGTPIITAFTGGETSPLTDGRVDEEGYYRSCATIKNMLVHLHGPAEKTPGTRFISAVKDSANFTKILPFKYSAADNYILELGDGYMRFYTQGGVVMSGMNPYEISTPWAFEDLDLLSFRQVADVMYFNHPLYPRHKLTRLGPTNWTLAAVENAWGPFLDQNETTVTIAASATTGAVLLTASSALFNPAQVGAQWKLINDYVISNSLTGLGQVTGAMILDAGESMIASLSGTWTATLILERSFDSGGTWLPYIQYGANTTLEVNNLEDNTYYRWRVSAYTSGTITARMTEKNRAGYVKITSYTSATVVGATVIQQLASTIAGTKWAEGAFSDYRGYPKACALYESRFIQAGTVHQPSTVWASKVDDFESFETGPTDQHAYQYTLASGEVNDILWMLEHSILSIGTIGDEWKFGFKDEPTTPNNPPDARSESAHGSAPIQALRIEGVPIFVEAGGRALRAITYSLDEDGYRAPRFTDHAEHMLRSGIVEMCFAGQPEPTIWMVRNDGKMAACTFSRAGKIAAFSLHDFGGSVESSAVIRENDRDELWIIVRRLVNGSYYRYVERMESNLWTDQADAFYVHSGLSYDGAPATVLGGLSHLEGETVNVLADGAVHRPLVVTGGGITMDTPASKVQAGLPYQALLKTKRIELRAASGTTQGKQKQTYRVVVRLERSLNCQIGYAENKLLPIIFRTTADPMGEPPALFTGDKNLPMLDRGTDDCFVVVESSDPTPLTVVSIAPTVYASEM